MGKFSGVLLASDLDGTLLNSNHAIDGENAEAIGYFVQNGGIFTLATGRPLFAAKSFFSELPVNAPVILYNGGALYDSQTEQVLALNPLSDGYLDVAKDVIRRYPDVGVEFHALDDIFLCRDSEVSRHHFEIIHKPLVITPIDDVRPPIIKGFFTQSPEHIGDVERYLHNHYKRRLSLTRSAPYFLEVMDKNVNKGAALRSLSKRLHVSPRHTCAIGDNFNDMEMIKAAKLSFAPENACGEIKKHAKYIVSDNDHFALRETVRILDKIYSDQK